MNNILEKRNIHNELLNRLISTCGKQCE